MRGLILIPARWASTRFPGKPLAPIAGTSLIQRVYERTIRAAHAEAVYVATDDDRIRSHVEGFGGKVVCPAGDYPSGTDRIAAALDMVETAEECTFPLVINVQGDEPLIDPASIDRVIADLHATGADMATLACTLESDEEYLSRDVVKVVTDLAGYALYFSRSPIPHGSRQAARRHIGLYGYAANVLRSYPSMPRTPLEIAESLEQLRALQNGLKIRVLETDKPHLGVDRPEDVLRVESELEKHV